MFPANHVRGREKDLHCISVPHNGKFRMEAVFYNLCKQMINSLVLESNVCLYALLSDIVYICWCLCVQKKKGKSTFLFFIKNHPFMISFWGAYPNW